MADNRLDAAHTVIGKIGGILGINEFLAKIEAVSCYELVTMIIPLQLIGYCKTNDSRLAQWQKGKGVFGYEVIIVGGTDRRILPAGRLGFLFKPREGDYFQIRYTVKSQIIGLTVYYHSLRDQINRLILEKEEAEKIASWSFEKQYYHKPIEFLWGSIGTQRMRDWEGERSMAKYQYEMEQEAKRLIGEIQIMQEKLKEFVTIRELLESMPQLKKIMKTYNL